MGLNFKSFVNHMVNPASWIQDAGQWMKDIKDHNEHVANRKNKQAMEAWQMQNEYNTPANQMQRLLDAGLNPNLAYSNVDTGNAKSAPDITNVGDNAPLLEGLIGHAFNAVQLMNGIEARKDAKEARQHQEEYQKDVLDFQKHQALINEAFRAQEMAFRQTNNQREYDRWMKDYDFRVMDADRRFNEMERHNRALENRGSLWNHSYGLLDSAILGVSGQHTDDSMTSTSNLLRRMAERQLDTLLDPRKSTLEKMYDFFIRNARFYGR